MVVDVGQDIAGRSAVFQLHLALGTDKALAAVIIEVSLDVLCLDLLERLAGFDQAGQPFVHCGRHFTIITESDLRLHSFSVDWAPKIEGIRPRRRKPINSLPRARGRVGEGKEQSCRRCLFHPLRQAKNLSAIRNTRSGLRAFFHSPAANLLASFMVG